eukprot:357586-Chlamydomonas_euryale.AAC.7
MRLLRARGLTSDHRPRKERCDPGLGMLGLPLGEVKGRPPLEGGRVAGEVLKPFFARFRQLSWICAAVWLENVL